MKKTLKIFLASFTLSLFAIWAADELYFSVSHSQSSPVAIPQKNIALFFQENETALPVFKTKSIKGSQLAAIMSTAEDKSNTENYISLFGTKRSAAKAINISSVEDAADIPLEYGSPQKANKLVPVQEQKQKSPPSAEVASENKTTLLSDAALEKKVFTEADKGKEERVEKEKSFSQPKTFKFALSDKKTTFIETDIIPLESNTETHNTGHIEVVSSAPQSQTAMAGDHISVDMLAIEQKDKEEIQQKREWQPMTVTSKSPWIVAQANKYAKNSKAVEDYADPKNKTKSLLAPQKMEEGEEVKTAEMVKNILIPIPEDILNDKNLTPQLVSPHKDTGTDSDDNEESGSTLLKSITSIFSSSSSNDNENNTEENTKPKKKRKKGLFAAFSEDKVAATKILPAEMKLAFQPGRAEISGQTLRWVQAFANKAVEDPNIFLEIRIDKNSSYVLQQRRLDLLNTILNSRGMDSSKVNTVFTSREPNSFIIRTLRLSDNIRGKPAKNYRKKSTNYQTW